MVVARLAQATATTSQVPSNVSLSSDGETSRSKSYSTS